MSAYVVTVSDYDVIVAFWALAAAGVVFLIGVSIAARWRKNR